MSRSRSFLILSIFCLVTVLAGSRGISAQGASPAPQQIPPNYAETERIIPTKPEEKLRGGTVLTDEGLWYTTPSVLPTPSHNTILTTGGPDLFGYVWDDAAAYTWIDVSGGMNPGIDCSDVFFTEDPVDIGFPFDFYENSYTQLYISCYGYLSFQGANLDIQQSGLPSNDLPNNVIAPLWTPVDSVVYINYKQTGVSPDKKFVIEWNTLVTDSGDSNFTFEVILHENGDIDFEFYTVSQGGDGGFTKGVGIENSEGTDGFNLIDGLPEFGSSTAIHITRPPDLPNVIFTPDVIGRFVSASTVEDYAITIKNYGSIGTDNYTLTAESDWSIALFEADHATPLANPITLDPGEEHTFFAVITTPSEVSATQTDVARVIATSGQEPTFSKFVTITSAVPAPFTQIVDDEYEDSTTKVLTINPEQRQTHSVPGEGYERTVLELPNQNILVAWTENVVFQEPQWHSYSVIRYAILDREGNEVVPPTTLLDTVGLPYLPKDAYEYVAVAPNGNIGILWRRYETVTYPDERTNLYFSIIEADGQGFVLAPTAITSQTALCTVWQDPGCIQYEDPHLDATQDGHFFLAWKELSNSGEDSIVNYQYSVYDSDGTVVKTISNLTSIADSAYRVNELTSTVLIGSRIFFAWNWEHYYQVGEDWEYEYSLNYSVMNSDGSVFELERSLVDEWISDADAVQLADGTIMIAHGYPKVWIYRFDGTTLDLLAPAQTLWQANQQSHAYYPSLIRGPFNTAVITWQFSDFETDLWHLYYALLSSDGTVLTPPISFMNFTDSLSGMNNVITSENGQSITTFAYDYMPFFRTDPLTHAMAGFTYAYNIVTDDGNLPDDTLVITAENKPGWMSFDDNGDGTAILAGIPPSPGDYNIDLKVVDTKSNSEFQQFKITVNEPPRIYLPLIKR